MNSAKYSDREVQVPQGKPETACITPTMANKSTPAAPHDLQVHPPYDSHGKYQLQMQ